MLVRIRGAQRSLQIMENRSDRAMILLLLFGELLSISLN